LTGDGVALTRGSGQRLGLRTDAVEDGRVSISGAPDSMMSDMETEEVHE
jgi:hypothetical protein